MASDSNENRRVTSPASGRVLIFAYYFPPMGLSGVQRTVKFAKYLSDFGWKPTVLTCEPGGYFAYDESLMQEVNDADVRVVRAPSWDPSRVFGRKKVVSIPSEPKRKAFSYVSQFLFVPDNKIGWWWPARRAALRLMSEQSFDLIFSSAPPYTAHLAAADVAASSGLPLVLDFRDDWLGNPRHRYPTPLHKVLSTYLERKALKASSRTVVINDVIRRNLAARNDGVIRPEDIAVIPQGYDPDDFRAAGTAEALDSRQFSLVYSGVFYDAQTPEPFLHGLADLITRRADLRSKMEAVFVGLVPESAKNLAESLGIGDMIRYTGYVPHRDAVAHVAAADALWMMVGRTEGAESISTSKLFEYFGSRKPVLGLVPDGAAKDALQRYGASEIADPDVTSEITAGIERLYEAWRESRLPEPEEEFVEHYDRRRLTRKLASVFDSVLRERRKTGEPMLAESAAT